MGFFPPETPADRGAGRERDRTVYRESGWGPVNGVLPVAVPFAAVISRSETVAVAVSDLSAYPNGLQFTIRVMSAVAPDADPYTSTDGVLRWGVRPADGRTAFGGPTAGPVGPLGAGALVLRGGGGEGSPGIWTFRCFLMPLPPPGSLTFAATWPAAGVPEGTVEVDAAPILEAAERAVTVFDLPERPRPAPGGEGGWSSYAPL